MYTMMTLRPAGWVKRPFRPMVNVRCGSSLKRDPRAAHLSLKGEPRAAHLLTRTGADPAQAHRRRPPAPAMVPGSAPGLECLERRLRPAESGSDRPQLS